MFAVALMNVAPSNYQLAREEQKRRRCVTCKGELELDRIRWALDNRLNLPTKCWMCKHSPVKR